MSEPLKKTTANWHTSLDVSCPNCGHYFDLELYGDSFEWIYPIETRHVDQEIKCLSCKVYFIVDEIERQ